MEYVAIDFETANKTNESACAIGLVRFDDEGNPLTSYYSLIRPRKLEFDPLCSAVHGLDPLDIASSPTIKELYNDINSFIGSSPLVAHNAGFDIAVLAGSLNSFGIRAPRYEYYDTLSLSRKLWKGKESYKLTSLAADFGWYYHAHNAREDALICGKIFSKLCGSNLFEEDLMKKFFKKVYKNDPRGYPRRLVNSEDEISYVLSSNYS